MAKVASATVQDEYQIFSLDIFLFNVGTLSRLAVLRALALKENGEEGTSD